MISDNSEKIDQNKKAKKGETNKNAAWGVIRDDKAIKDKVKKYKAKSKKIKDKKSDVSSSSSSSSP